MKVKHNKKRNTAFVYEALLRESTMAILREKHETKNKIVALIKKHFGSESILRHDLECYRSLYEARQLDRLTSEKILKEAKEQKSRLNEKELFESQSDLIKDINQTISANVFNNYIPNYRTLATIDQIFSARTSPKNKVILESLVVAQMGIPVSSSADSGDIDKLVYNSFVKKFNKKYDSNLLEEQRTLLSYYINSFADNALELKVFLNEEIARMRSRLQKALSTEIISEDGDMTAKTQKLIEKLDSYGARAIDEEVLTTVLKTQQIVKDIFEDGSCN
jgi:hypothetical protein